VVQNYIRCCGSRRFLAVSLEANQFHRARHDFHAGSGSRSSGRVGPPGLSDPRGGHPVFVLNNGFKAISRVIQQSALFKVVLKKSDQSYKPRSQERFYIPRVLLILQPLAIAELRVGLHRDESPRTSHWRGKALRYTVRGGFEPPG
jgi:hypothetical protein